jgi:hypothetical protein
VRSRPGILPASLIGYPAKCGREFIDKGTDRDTHSSARLYNNINALDEEAKHDKCENFFKTQRKMRGTCSVTITRLIVSFCGFKLVVSSTPGAEQRNRGPEYHKRDRLCGSEDAGFDPASTVADPLRLPCPHRFSTFKLDRFERDRETKAVKSPAAG